MMFIPHIVGDLLGTILEPKRKKRELLAVPDVSNNTFLFIGGLHRSGTSLLHRLLRDHPSTSGFVDTGVPEDEGQHLQTVFPAAKAYGGPGRFAFDLGSHLSETSDLLSEANRDVLLREWGAYYEFDKQVLLEKSPPNLIRSRFFQALFPGSRFLFIVRHPVAVSLSTQKMSGAAVIESMLHWYISHYVLMNDLAKVDNFLILRYEDFVKDPQFYLDEICSFVGIDSFRPTEKIADHNEKYFCAWLSRHGCEKVILENAFPEMLNFASDMGYSISESLVSDITDSDLFLTP